MTGADEVSHLSPAARASVVVVIHNSADVVADCVRSIASDAELIVVDNASTDGGAQLVQQIRQDALIVAVGRNAGFGAGCNTGAAHATRAVLLFLNPDARLGSGALERLVETAEFPGSGLVGPALFGDDGRRQLTCRRWSTLTRDLAESLPRWETWGPAWLQRDLPADAPVYTEGGTTAYTHGASMAMVGARFDEAGGFDEDLFLYGEEESLALRFRALGLRSMHAPQARVTHIGGTSIGRVPHLARYHLTRSRIILYRKTTGRRLPAGVVLGLATSIRLLVTVANIAFGRERKDTVRDHAVAIRGIAAGLSASLNETPSYRPASRRRPAG